MDKPLGQFKGGGKTVLPDDGEEQQGQMMVRKPRLYKFRAVDFKVVIGKESGAPYVVIDSVVINPCQEQGMHTELGFSLSSNSESIAAAWLFALGFDEESMIPVDDADRLEVFLKKLATNSIFKAAIIKEKRGQYSQNSVSPPWEVGAAEIESNDLPAQGVATGRGEQPSF